MSDQVLGAHSRPIDELIGNSSLGTNAARRLRNRTPVSQAGMAQRLGVLRNAAAHGDLDDLAELGELYEQLGAHADAEDCYRRVAASSLIRLAALLELQGETDMAAQWKARARTIYPTNETHEQANPDGQAVHAGQDFLSVARAVGRPSYGRNTEPMAPLTRETDVSTEAAVHAIKDTMAERIFIWLAETAEHPSPPQVAQALNLPGIEAQTACHWLEELRLVEFDNTLAMTMHVSIQGEGAAKRLLAERASGKSRRSALRTSLLNWLSDNAPKDVESMSDFEGTQRASLDGSKFTEQEILSEAAFLRDQGLIQGVEVYETEHLLDAHLTTSGRDCVDRFDSDVNAWLSRGQRGMVTHNETTFSNSPGAQSMNGSPGAQQTATVTISQDNRRQLLQIADQIADQVAGLPDDVALAAEAGVEDLRQAANPDHPDDGRIKAALGKIAMTVAIAASTEAGRKIIELIGQAQQLLTS